MQEFNDDLIIHVMISFDLNQLYAQIWSRFIKSMLYFSFHCMLSFISLASESEIWWFRWVALIIYVKLDGAPIRQRRLNAEDKEKTAALLMFRFDGCNQDCLNSSICFVCCLEVFIVRQGIIFVSCLQVQLYFVFYLISCIVSDNIMITCYYYKDFVPSNNFIQKSFSLWLQRSYSLQQQKLTGTPWKVILLHVFADNWKN